MPKSYLVPTGLHQAAISNFSIPTAQHILKVRHYYKLSMKLKIAQMRQMRHQNNAHIKHI